MRCVSHFEMIRGKAYPWLCHSYKAAVQKHEQKQTFTLFFRPPARLARILHFGVVSRMRRPCILVFPQQPLLSHSTQKNPTKTGS